MSIPTQKKPKTLREADFDDPETTKLQIKYLGNLDIKYFQLKQMKAYFKLFSIKK